MDTWALTRAFMRDFTAELEDSLNALNKEVYWVGKPLFKGPNELIFGHPVQKFKVLFGHYGISAEIKNFHFSRCDGIESREPKVQMYHLITGTNRNTSELFFSKAEQLYLSYIETYIEGFEDKIIGSLNYFKEKWKDPTFEFIKREEGLNYFYPPQFRVIRQTTETKRVRHKPGESFWVSVWVRQKYDLEIDIEASNNNVEVIKNFINSRDRHYNYEQPYHSISGKEEIFEYQAIDTKLSYQIKHNTITTLREAEGDYNTVLNSPILDIEILKSSVFFLFCDVKLIINHISSIFKSSKALLYEELYWIYACKLGHMTYNDNIGSKRYDALNLRQYEDLYKNIIDEELNKKFKDFPLEKYLENFLINYQCKRFDIEMINYCLFIFLSEKV